MVVSALVSMVKIITAITQALCILVLLVTRSNGIIATCQEKHHPRDRSIIRLRSRTTVIAEDLINRIRIRGTGGIDCRKVRFSAMWLNFRLQFIFRPS